MSGNVYEWCFDWHPSQIGSSRVIRGGSWDHNDSCLRLGSVNSRRPYFEYDNLGFRFARTP